MAMGAGSQGGLTGEATFDSGWGVRRRSRTHKAAGQRDCLGVEKQKREQLDCGDERGQSRQSAGRGGQMEAGASQKARR